MKTYLGFTGYNQMTRRMTRRIGAALAGVLAFLALGMLSPLSAKADFAIPFDKIFSGGSPASTNTPWVNASFADVGPGTVRLTVSNLTLTGAESVEELYLNINPSYNPSNLIFSETGSSSNFFAPTIATQTDHFKADGDGKYDILFSFATTGPTNRFINSEYIVFQISGIPTLTAADFDYLSAPAGGSGPFYGALHLQSTSIGEDSGWASGDHIVSPDIPEPGTATLGLLALTSWFGLRRSRRGAKASGARSR